MQGPSSAVDELFGRRFGPYVLGDKIGGGSVAQVHRAEDSVTGSSLAIKVARRPPGDPARDRILQEAMALKLLEHPSIARFYDAGSDGDLVWVAMELIDGPTLFALLGGGPLPWPVALAIARHVIGGLAYAHARGVMHRDIKPTNVMIDRAGAVKLVDFGLAKQLDPDPSGEITHVEWAHVRTTLGAVLGTPSYMAPEQARGEPCDGRTDIFSMGIVLWEALVHQRLFWAEMDMAVLVQVMDCEIDRPDVRNPRVPARLADVAMKALAASPADRYASAREFATALEKAADSVELLATTHEVEETLGRILSEEIAEKHAAVVQHLSASSGEPRALQKGQLGTVPRLVSKKPSFRDLPTRGAASGVRPRSSSTDAGRARHEAAIAPTATATPIPPVTSASVALPTRSSAPIAIGVAIAVAAAAGAYAWFSRSNESATAAEPTASHAPGTSEAAPTTPAAAVAPTAPAVAAPAVAAPVVAAPAVTAPVAADPPVVDPAAVGAATDPAAEQAPSPARAHPSSAEPTADEGASARRRPHASTPSPATLASPAPAAPPAEDEVEANPYVVR